MDIEGLERRRRDLKAEMAAFLGSWSSAPGWGDRFRQLSAELHAAERELAKAKGEEYAVPCDLGVHWDVGAPLPHVLSNGRRTYVIFLLDEPDPAWDGSTVTLKSPSSGAVEALALVEFDGATHRFGAPNDEVMEGHPLHGKGLEPYGAHYVLNSRWIRELQQINSVHAQYDPSRWTQLKHYLFAFHDETFECIARGHRVETHRASLAALVHSVAVRLTSD